jgi:K+-sensing histidine kinase KdpD
VIISVEDTGAGFSPSLLDQINQELNDRDGQHVLGTFQSRHGLRLGIALMVRVARLHSGGVAFGNRQHEPGAWVQFRLPAQAAQRPIGVIGVRTTLDALAA